MKMQSRITLGLVAAGFVAGAAVGALIGPGFGFLLLAPLGAVAAVARLERVYREPQRLVSAGE